MTYAEALELSPKLAELPPREALQVITVPKPADVKKFLKERILTISKDEELIGDTVMGMRHGERRLCGGYNGEKLTALKELIESTTERMIIFYQYQEDLNKIKALIKTRPLSFINGQKTDLTAYETKNDSITLCQWQAGARGHNLQKASITVFFNLTESYELWEQSFGRTHRIGQVNACRYYLLLTEDSIEEDIKEALDRGEDFTLELYKRKRGIE